MQETYRIDKDGVTLRGASTVRVEGILMRLEIDGIRVSGDEEDLAALANRTLTEGCTGEFRELLRRVSEFDRDYQREMVSMLARGDFKGTRELIELTWRYNEFSKRKFEYFPKSDQLLLDTDKVITFGKDTVRVQWASVDLENFNTWLRVGAVAGKDRTALSDSDVEALQAAAGVVQQHSGTLGVLALVSQFSRKKQREILDRLERGPLTASEIERLKEDLSNREKARKRREEYRSLGARFRDLYLRKETCEALARTHCPGIDYFLIRFGRDLLTDVKCEVYAVKADYGVDTDELVGRWIKTGHLSEGKRVRVEEQTPEDIVDHERELKRIAGELEEPYRGWLETFLVDAKLTVCSGEQS